MERPLTGQMRADRKPLSLSEYAAAGGYQAFTRALREMRPEDVTQVVKDSKLRGRGGAGFYTGGKWAFVPLGPDAPRPKYFLVNADEMEPGTFKDRLLLECHPHLLIEGTALGAYAIGAEIAYIFLRREYRHAARVVQAALAEARTAGHLGERIHGSAYSLEIHLHISAGRYICGEETALISALEGKRANPRAKPPYPPLVGLWGKPTVVQNVETVCNVPGIIQHGAPWFLGLSRVKDGGTKLYGVSGKVRAPGLWELPLGVTAREILEQHAGGMRPGLRLRGFLPGGASTDFLSAEQLDVVMDFEAVPAAGSRMGTGTMIVLDDRTCPVGATLNLTRFFAQESCGWCTPCRDGLPWAAKILHAIESGDGREGDLALLEHHCRWLGPGYTFCALAPGAVEPLQSALKLFREDFLAHIREQRCPYGNRANGGAERARQASAAPA
ncbi:MAG: SLBB domain-containing protein [Candidatus Eisenbacteria bacterium]|nr:SLBB domain-containing protein [Candidatus Eisenbacteria bacterium]